MNPFDDESPEPYENDVETFEQNELARDLAAGEGEPDDDEDDDFDDDDDDLADRMMDREFFGEDDDFACPGGVSALRAASPSNPRDCECPSCGRQNVLTRKDMALGYQCDTCANAAEGHGP